MDNMLMEYSTKFWDMGFELKVDIRYDGNRLVFIANMCDRFTRSNEAGGGFAEPLKMFEYLDRCMECHARTGQLLPSGGIAHGYPYP